MKRLFAAFAVAAIGLAALDQFAVHALQPLENRLLDAFVRWHAARLAPDPDVVVVSIDESSLARMEADAGRFPWPREVYAVLLEGLMAQAPRAVVFDILFAERDKQAPQNDQRFVDVALPHRNVFFPMVKLEPEVDARGAPAGELAPLIGLVRRPGADPDTRFAVIPPLALPPALWRGGPINFLEDEDGVGRRYLLRSVVGGWALPSLPARVALDLGYPVPDADEFILAWRGAARELPHVAFADLYEDFLRCGAKAPGERVRGQDRHRRRRGAGPGGPARNAALGHAAGRGDPRHGDREPEERPRHGSRAGVAPVRHRCCCWSARSGRPSRRTSPRPAAPPRSARRAPPRWW